MPLWLLLAFPSPCLPLQAEEGAHSESQGSGQTPCPRSVCVFSATYPFSVDKVTSDCSDTTRIETAPRHTAQPGTWAQLRAVASWGLRTRTPGPFSSPGGSLPASEACALSFQIFLCGPMLAVPGRYHFGVDAQGICTQANQIEAHIEASRTLRETSAVTISCPASPMDPLLEDGTWHCTGHMWGRCPLVPPSPAWVTYHTGTQCSPPARTQGSLT